MLADLATPALVLGADLGPLPDGVVHVALGDPVPDEKWATVLLAVADETALRLAVSALPELGRTKHVGCHLASAAGPVTTVLRPEWPALVALEADASGGGALTRMKFRRPAPVGPVLVELARHTGTPAVTGNRGLVLSGFAVPVDPTAVTDEVPAAVLAAGPVPATEVLGIAPVVVDPGFGPLDEALLNPRGFRTDWDRGPVPVPDGEPTPAMVASLRDAQAVVVGPASSPRTVAGLAMAGVPLVGGEFGTPDLDDPLRREEHSVRLRREALRRHSSLGWRQRTGASAGIRVASYPSVSVLLTVRRSDRLERALDQVAQQRGVDRLEVLLASEGAEPLGDVVVTMSDAASYGPDVVADLLLARHYSGADVVGMSTTPGDTECFVERLPDGPLCIDRELLHAVGGVENVRAAGGTIYVTHNLGVDR